MAANDPLVKSASPGQVNDSISGTQFNGLTQATAYGDDFQNATNHPLVRIVHTNGGHIFCGKTHTQFDLPDDIELGPSNIRLQFGFVFAHGESWPESDCSRAGIVAGGRGN